MKIIFITAKRGKTNIKWFLTKVYVIPFKSLDVKKKKNGI